MRTADEGLPSVARWFSEEAKHAQHGDYIWLAGLLGNGAGHRVLEVGCGGGYGTAALLAAGFEVLTLEPLGVCRDTAAARCGTRFRSLDGQAGALEQGTEAAIAAFDPDMVVCWMIGVEEKDLPAANHPVERVRLARERVHRAVAELAARLPGVVLIHLADRTAFPWKIKNIARETQVKYHLSTSFRGLPFRAGMGDALFRKLEPRDWLEPPRPAAAGLPSGIVPVLGSLLAHRDGSP